MLSQQLAGPRFTDARDAVEWMGMVQAQDYRMMRWAVGMLEGLSTVRPWQQGSIYSRYFSLVNLSVIWLDLAFLFGFVPGLLLAALGYFYLAGCLTLTTLAVCLVFFLSTYLYQKQLHIPFYNSVWGFVWFLAVFQMIQSTAAIHGYLLRLLHRKGEWK